jgi:hypothetical protein
MHQLFVGVPHTVGSADVFDCIKSLVYEAHMHQ